MTHRLVHKLDRDAEVCPGGQEDLTSAAIMSIENIASIFGDASGSYLFYSFFHTQARAADLVSAGFTAVAALFGVAAAGEKALTL